VSRDYDPVPGQWYEDLEREETFQVISLDPDEELVRIQWLEGDVEEFDLDTWSEMDVEPTDEPEGWAGDDEDEDVEEEEEEEEEDDDDWDDEDEDEDDEDDDWDDDEDDEYRDRG
jgi:hypothetical protein